MAVGDFDLLLSFWLPSRLCLAVCLFVCECMCVSVFVCAFVFACGCVGEGLSESL